MDLQLTGKHVLVMAASKGLGKATALQFAREGAHVAICARSKAVEQAASEITRETGADVVALRADVTQADDVDRVIHGIVDRWGGLDILVTNSGGPPAKPFVALALADWQAAVDLMLLSTVQTIKLALPYLQRSSTPAILTITSSSTKQPIQNLILSNSIRLAVVGLTKTLSHELAGDRIRVNSILPGWTMTERVEELITSRVAQHQSTPEAEIGAIAASIPIGRMGTPAEFANVAVFLCSPAASYVNGVMLQVDGGSHKGTL